MLDQLTDRCATMALLMTLSHLYPDYMFALQISAVVDVASHWLHLHRFPPLLLRPLSHGVCHLSTDLTGGSSHKSSSNPVLHLYYTSRPFLFFMCAGNELFYATLYLCYFTYGPRCSLLPLPPLTSRVTVGCSGGGRGAVAGGVRALPPRGPDQVRHQPRPPRHRLPGRRRRRHEHPERRRPQAQAHPH